MGVTILKMPGTSVISALERLKQGDLKLEDSLGYTSRN